MFFTLATLLLVSSCSCKSKLWRCLILGIHCSEAHRGLHSRTVAAGSGALGKLWAPLLYALFKGGHWRPSSVTAAWDTHDKTPALETRKKGCLQSVRLLNKPEMKPWVFFLRHFCIICLSVLAILISIYNMGISVSKADAVLHK